MELSIVGTFETIMNKNDLPYLNYWEKKKIQSNSPAFGLTQYYIDSLQSPSMHKILDIIHKGESVLDYGAGDLKLKTKYLGNYKGEYFSQDIGEEFEYSFQSIEEIQRSFDTIVALDVIEHMPLEDGLYLISQLLEKLTPNGTLILQTPNGKCIRNHLGSDMTHKQLYNLPDLYAYYKAQKFTVTGYRVHFTYKSLGPFGKIKDFLSRFISTKILGVDYADNILLFISNT